MEDRSSVYRRHHDTPVSWPHLMSPRVSIADPGGKAAPGLALELLLESMPPAPPEPLDTYLDTAASCFARHGISRTSLPDIARELGVSRTTVYRRAVSIENLASLLLAREVRSLMVTVPALLHDAEGPSSLAGLLAGVVRFCRDHPIVAKVLEDEQELIGPFLVRHLPAVVAQVRVAAVPLLVAAMDGGLIRRCDPSALAELLVRQVVICIITPPEVDIAEFLERSLVPLLEP